MNKLIQLIADKHLGEAKDIFESTMLELVEKKLVSAKKIMMSKEQTEIRKAFDGNPGARAEKLYRDIIEEMPVLEGELDEALDELDEARVKIIKARIRGGKIQRRKKVSNIPGYTLRAGKLKRMSAMERRHRKMGQRRGKLKRKAKLSRILMKRKRSLMKRHSIGLK